MDLGNGPIDKQEIKKCFHKRYGNLEKFFVFTKIIWAWQIFGTHLT